MNQPKLQKDIKECLNAIRRTWREKGLIMAWDMSNNHLKSFELSIRDVSDKNKKITLTPSKECADWDNIRDIIKGSGILNFFLLEESIVFRSELLNLEEDYLIIKYPVRWMLEERRVKERFESIGAVQVHMPIKSGRIKPFRVFDVSETGLSIILPRGEAQKFNNGDVYEDVLLALGPDTTRVGLEVMNTNKLQPYQLEKSPYAAKKIGFKFNSKNETVKTFLDTLGEVTT